MTHTPPLLIAYGAAFGFLAGVFVAFCALFIHRRRADAGAMQHLDDLANEIEVEAPPGRGS